MGKYLRCFLFALFLIVFAAISVHGQNLTKPKQAQPARHGVDKVAPIRIAPLFGRGGTAFSQAAYVEVNPTSWFGAGLIVGRSGVSGYKDQGAVADVNDFSSGIVLVGRYPKPVVPHLRIGAFVQSVYNGSHVSAKYSESYPDGNGGFIQVQGTYHESDRNPITTVGANIEYYIPHGPPILFRIGKNLGDGLPAKTADGLYFGVAPMADPVPPLIASGKMAWRLLHKL